MNTQSANHARLIPAALMAALPGPLLAATLTVTTPGDPDVPDGARCTAATANCSLRDALAAADATPAHDLIVFDVNDPIYLKRKLSAQTPVTLDGAGVTRIRIDQGYDILTLPGGARILQPAYSAIAAGGRYMLELGAGGSTVTGLGFDGSVAPLPGEAGVDAFDFNSDGVPDYYALNGESDGESVWLVTGGIRADFTPPGATDCSPGLPLQPIVIQGNTLQNLGGSGIEVAFHVLATIADNVISGGGFGQQGWDYDGVFMFCGGAANVSGNEVFGYRSGISLAAGSAFNITGNTVSGNGLGLDIEFVNGDAGPSLVADNESAANHHLGMLLLLSSAIHVMDNEFRDNGTDPQAEGGIALIGSSENVIAGNESQNNSGFGIVLDRSWLNEVTANETQSNGGAGIVLVNNAQFNAVTDNESKLNGAGIVLAKTIVEEPFPANNSIDSNEAQGNWANDLEDLDPACNDGWSNNRFDSAYAASGACIQ